MSRARAAARPFLATVLAVACGAVASGPASAATVWAVQGAHDTVYLAGSVHVLKPGDDALPPAFDRAYARARSLVMEIDVEDLDPAAGQDYVLEHGMLPGDETLRTVVGEPRYGRIEKEAARVGLPLEGLQRFEPWTVALTLTQLEFAALGLEPDAGVERQLGRRAHADGKPIRGLETLEDQLALLHGLSYEDQSRFLELAATEARDAREEADELLAAWRSGDERKLERLLSSEYEDFPSLFRRLVTDRNRRWIPALVALLDGDRDTLVVVGALHLVGSDGVVALLRRKGYRVQPLD